MDSRESGDPLSVTGDIGNLGALRDRTLRKAWHTDGDTLHGGADFYLLLALV